MSYKISDVETVVEMRVEDIPDIDQVRPERVKIRFDMEWSWISAVIIGPQVNANGKPGKRRGYTYVGGSWSARLKPEWLTRMVEDVRTAVGPKEVPGGADH